FVKTHQNKPTKCLLPFRSTSHADALPSHSYGWPKPSSLKSTYRRHGFDEDDLKGYRKTRRAQLNRFLRNNWMPLTISIVIFAIVLIVRGQYPKLKTDTDDTPTNDANIDLTPFDDSFKLPMHPDLFNHNYPPFLSSMKLSESQKKKVWNSRAKAVARAFSHAWEGYVDFAWGKDELNPRSKTGKNGMGMGLMIVDSLDSAWLINKTIYERSYNWITKEQGLIRSLGALLSSYHLSKEVALLKEAVGLAEQLLPAFTSSLSGVPFNSINFQTGKPNGDQRNISTAAALSLQLEFKYLTHITNDPKFWNAVQNASNHCLIILVPKQVDISKPKFIDEDFNLGRDSGGYYEYLVKQSLLTKNSETFFAQQSLLLRSDPSNLLYVRGIQGPFAKGIKTDQMDQSTCSMGAILALSATKGLYLAEELAQTCYEMFHQTVTGLAPTKVLPKDVERMLRLGHSSVKAPIALENVRTVADGKYNLDFQPEMNEGSSSLLGPEALETFFVLFRVTGDEKYREWGWRIFRSMEQWAKVPSGGYSGLTNATRMPPTQNDKMESFLMAATFKYLYLLFADASILPLDQYAFNRGAHPLPVFQVRGDLKPKLLWL
ncbi:glycoside hydrolase, partial [Obelidium mucronatum]